jgi:hypothetical protein
MLDNQLKKTAIGPPDQWLIEAAAAIGIDIAGLVHETTNYFKNHSLKRHSNESEERTQGQVPVTAADFALIPDIVSAPDCTIIGIKRNSETLIAYSKKIDDWTAIYYEEILNSRKNTALRSTTLFKKRGTVTKEKFLNIITSNAHTDIAGVKVVVGTGGHPGGEAE